MVEERLDEKTRHELIRLLSELVCIEEHCLFSYLETKKEIFLKIRDEVQRDRKRIQSLFKNDDKFEIHCLYKHIAKVIKEFEEVADDVKSKKLKIFFFKLKSNYYNLFRVLEEIDV